MPDNLVNVANSKLLLNGSELSKELFLAVSGVTVEDEINLPAMFTIKFNTVDFQKGAWKGVDLDIFKIGDTVKVFMGIDRMVEMMTGEITSFDFAFGESYLMEIR